MMLVECQNPECEEHDVTHERPGRMSFGQAFLDEPFCDECGELLDVVGGASVA